MINFFDNDMREIWASRDSGSTFPISRVYFESIQVWPSTPPTPVVTYYFNISPTAITVDSTSQNFTITATTDSPLWEIVSTPSWFTFSGTTQIGDNEYSLVFSVENNTGDTRQDFVTFRYQSNSRGAKAFVVMGVTQEEGKPCNIIRYTSTNSQVVVPYNTTGFGVNIVSNTYYPDEGYGEIVFDGDVTQIGYNAFSDCYGLTGIIIPDSVTTIDNRAFFRCSALSNIVIPDSVTTIGNQVFWNCVALSSVIIGSGVTTIGFETFADCRVLSSITIPNGVTTINESTFYDCQALLSITIPDSVTTIGRSAFKYCYALSSITIPDSVTTIGTSAFEYCTRIPSITIPDGVTTIGTRIFDHCVALSSVTIGSGVTSIGYGAFSGCTSLSSIVIPSGVTEIGQYAFDGCTSLSSISYNGTKAQWASIRKRDYWHRNVPATVIHCTDGDRPI